MAVALVYISTMSNVLAVCIVVLCLLGMMGYIYRLRGDFLSSSSSVTYVNQPCIQQAMNHVQIPFSLHLLNKESDGIRLKITNNSPCLLQTFWCVNITDLHSAFSLPWQSLRQSMLDHNEHFLSDVSFATELVRSFKDPCETHLDLRQPDGFEVRRLGPVPRTKYPIAIVVIRDEDDAIDDDTSVVAMLTVVHIEDDVFCKIKTCVLFQHLKQGNGCISNLKSLYVSGNEESHEVDENETNACICIVCQMKPVSLALLPCRHTCICNECFTKLDRCPLCRSTIVSYFRLQNSYY